VSMKYFGSDPYWRHKAVRTKGEATTLAASLRKGKYPVKARVVKGAAARGGYEVYTRPSMG